jgi:hypothetical protein
MATEGQPTLTEEQQDLLKTGTFFQTLSKDPKYRKRVLGLLKEANPDTPIPELDLENEMETRVAERVKPFEETHKTLTERLERVESKVARDSWQSKMGLADEELVEVEELAKKDGITKGETAVEYWRMKNQLGGPRPTRKAADNDYITTLSKISPMNGPALKRAATAEAMRILNESRGRIRSA